MTMEKRLETITVDRIAQNMAGMDRHELRAHAGVALSHGVLHRLPALGLL